MHKPNAVYSVAKGTDTTQPAAKGKALNLSLQRRPETRDAVYNFINLYKYDKSLYDFSRSRSAEPEGKAKGHGQGRWEFSVGENDIGLAPFRYQNEKTPSQQLPGIHGRRERTQKQKREIKRTREKFYTYAYTEIIKKNALH